MKRDDVIELSGYQNLLFADGFDDAIIGVAERAGQSPVVAYNTHKCIDILIIQGMSEDEAWEYFDYNVIGSYMGDQTPVFIVMPKEKS